MAREHVTVVLSGDGGDEMLGGYDRYRWNTTLAGLMEGRFAGASAACGAALNQMWPEHIKGRGLVRLLVGDSRERYRRLLADGWLARQSVVGLSDLSAFSEAWDEGTTGLLDRMCKADLGLYLPEDLMVKVDRACMAVGLEPRAPFLDRPLFEFLSRTPTVIRGAGRDSKRPLRRIVGRVAGPRAATRKKQGFAVPLGHWFRHELRDLISDLLTRQTSFVSTLFPREFVPRLIDAHAKGTRDLSHRLWALLVLERWHDQFCRDTALVPSHA
jgi:asparagine synthase (glutamine-hydrolysing)